MNQDPLTLYKLIVLYMLNRVAFPLTKSQIGDFILEREYTNFLTLQTAIAELNDAGLIDAKSIRNRTHLAITEEGINTLHYFENRISGAIKEEISQYLKDNEFDLRNEVSIVANYYKSTAGGYEAELQALDKGVELINIRLNVPIEEIATTICDNWQKKNQEIYQYLTEKLF
ncbi:MAG: DUF4364 family protein [Lachnospiraceae bacterium]|nr:DUF4364 family protein [Lachnospiraceae bacterium]